MHKVQAQLFSDLKNYFISRTASWSAHFIYGLASSPHLSSRLCYVCDTGGGITQNEDMIMASIRNGDVSGAADGIAKAIRNSDAEAVLQAVRKSVSEGRSSVVGDVLETAIRSKGVDAVELATILSPLCGSDEECASFLMQIAKTGL